MGLLKKVEKKPLRSTGRGGGGSVSALRPQQTAKRVPCTTECPSGTHIREWVQIIAQREKTKTGEDEALTKAWLALVETNPFPAVMGRVCPHPCEDKCNRQAKDGAVNINALERFIGDWALEHQLQLPRIEGDGPREEPIGVIGAGPAGLSFAYQMARRGYRVTVYEKSSKAGGMLYWGIPFYRLPADVLEGEIRRIADLGVEIKLNTTVGKDVSVEELRAKHRVIFLGIGADQGRLMKVPGEEGPGVWTGTDYLFRVNNGEKVEVGRSVAVIGGGDTAVDAARAARRAGAEVTILYRRTRVEMPAIESEIEDALKEGVKIEYLVAPVGVKRDGEKLRTIVVQKMELGEPDESGRRRPVPIEGSEYEIPVSTLIAAISQEPNWQYLDALRPQSRWLTANPHGKVADGLWTGGDVLNLGLATIAIGQGRLAAEAAHAELTGLEAPRAPSGPAVAQERLKLDFYEPKPRVERAHRPLEEWLTRPDEEIALGLSKEQFLEELTRCFSCGLCFGCERCWMYCTPSCFSKVQAPFPGDYYKIKLDTCDGCKKCADECPCGFLDMI